MNKLEVYKIQTSIFFCSFFLSITAIIIGDFAIQLIEYLFGICSLLTGHAFMYSFMSFFQELRKTAPDEGS